VVGRREGSERAETDFGRGKCATRHRQLSFSALRSGRPFHSEGAGGRVGRPRGFCRSADALLPRINAGASPGRTGHTTRSRRGPSAWLRDDHPSSGGHFLRGAGMGLGGRRAEKTLIDRSALVLLLGGVLGSCGVSRCKSAFKSDCGTGVEEGCGKEGNGGCFVGYSGDRAGNDEVRRTQVSKSETWGTLMKWIRTKAAADSLAGYSGGLRGE
jgi:hypothetical protein